MKFKIGIVSIFLIVALIVISSPSNGLLFEKNQQLTKYLKLDKNIQNQVLRESVEEPEVNDIPLQGAPNIQDIKESDEADKHQKSIESENVLFQLKIPKIQIPKIYLPKVNINKPKVNVKENRKN